VIIKNDQDVPEFKANEEGVSNVTGRILIGPTDGSDRIIMRRFQIHHGGNTPHHLHPHEHVVKVLNGRGRLVDGQGSEHELKSGQSAFVPGGERHQFRNPYDEPFEFLCIILNPDRS
jgi:quercetin dioxygenase-like cupin family protein